MPLGVQLLSCSYAYWHNWWPFTTYGMIGGFIVSSFICAPDWQCFNMDPEGWHPAIDPEKEIAYYEKTQRKKQKSSQVSKKQQKKDQKKRDKKEKKRKRKKEKAAKLAEDGGSIEQIKVD